MQDIGFLYNVQHDCVLAKCMASGMQPLLHRDDELGKLLGQHHGLTKGVGMGYYFWTLT